jgi:hypothetical protein
MRVRKKARFKTEPDPWDLGWRDGTPLVGVTLAEAALAHRLGISKENYVRTKLELQEWLNKKTERKEL